MNIYFKVKSWHFHAKKHKFEGYSMSYDKQIQTYTQLYMYSSNLLENWKKNDNMLGKVGKALCSNYNEH